MMAQWKTWTTVAVLVLIAGCSGGVTPEEARQAQKLARAGNVKELQEMLEQKPAIANAMVDEDTSILELMVDVLPPYPNQHDSIKLLLDHGADPNRDAPEILRKAIWRGEPEIVEMLLEYGADPTIVSPKKEMNMLEYARSTGDKRFEPIVDAWETKQKS